MQFFSNSLSQFNKRYSNLFGIEDEEKIEEGKDGGREDDDDGDSEETRNAYQDKWGWIESVDTVSETIREPWSVVFKMNIVEFLNILCYIKDRGDERKRQMQKYKESIRNKR